MMLILKGDRDITFLFCYMTGIGQIVLHRYQKNNSKKQGKYGIL